MKSLSYQNVYLVPNYSSLASRSEADIRTNFLGFTFKAPWLPANMESVINEDIADWLAEKEYFYIYHRFGDTRKFLQRTRAEAWKMVSISVGVKESDRELILDIAQSKCRVDFITIDIAHGHSILMKDMISFISKNLPGVRIIAGNVATAQAVADLASWGANAVKVGIAGGQACSTKNQTGFHIPMFSCTQRCSHLFDYIPIIADGGIRENGDIPKALVAGAQMVMAGGMFAACIDAPGDNVRAHHPDSAYTDLKSPIIKKRYHGSASAKQKGYKKHVEGYELEIPCNGMTISEKYEELSDSLKSAVSYAGGSDLSAFKKVNYICV